MVASMINLSAKIPQGYEHSGLFGGEYQQQNYQDIQSSLRLHTEQVAKVLHQEGITSHEAVDLGDPIEVEPPEFAELEFNPFVPYQFQEEYAAPTEIENATGNYQVSPMPTLNPDPIEPIVARLDVIGLESGNISFSTSSGTQSIVADRLSNHDTMLGDSHQSCCCCCDGQNTITVNVDVTFNTNPEQNELPLLSIAPIEDPTTNFADILLSSQTQGDLPVLEVDQISTDDDNATMIQYNTPQQPALQHDTANTDLSSDNSVTQFDDIQQTLAHDGSLHATPSLGQLDTSIINVAIDHSTAQNGNLAIFDTTIDDDSIAVA